MDDSSMDLTGAVTSHSNLLEASKIELQSMKEKYEVIYQENHTLKKRIEVVERINSDLESEISYISKSKAEDKLGLSAMQLEIDNAQARAKHFEFLLDEEKKNFQRYLKETREKEVNGPESNPSILHDQEQLNILSGQVESLEILQEEDKESIRVLLDEKVQFLDTIKQLNAEKQALQNELTEIKEHLENKTIDLRNLNDVLEGTREEKMLLNTELQMLKASDCNAPRGNSLFAEVEENRQKMAAQREFLKLKYGNLKKIFGQKQVEVNKLKLEINKLRREEKEDEEGFHRDYDILIQTYKQRNTELEVQVKTLQQLSKQPEIGLSKDEDSFKWVHTVIENARKEAETLQTELEKRGSNYVIQGHQLFDSQKENRKLKTANLKLMSVIDELRLELETIRSANKNIEDGISPPATDIIVEYQKQKVVKFQEVIQNHNSSQSQGTAEKQGSDLIKKEDSVIETSDKENLPFESNVSECKN